MTREETKRRLEQEPLEVEATKLQEAYNKGFEDCRQAVLDLAKKGVLVSNGNYTSVCKAINDLPPVKQEPSGDVISLETVIEWLKTKDIIKLFSQEETARKELKALPSVEQEPKTGHWIAHPKGIYAHLVCDKCLSRAPYDCKTNYCPNCGAKMVEPQESEDKE